MEHKCELEVVVTRSDTGIVSPSYYVVTNVSGKLISKGDDTLYYSITFLGINHFIPVDDIITIVKVAPTCNQRRGGRAECGFAVSIDRSDLDDPGHTKESFYMAKAGYSVVLSPAVSKRMAEKIFFTLVDVNFEPTGLPLWRIGVDDSAILAMFQPRWIPLKPIHPDPAVDPGVPIEKRPQGLPGWYWFRSDCDHHEIFKGKLSGTRIYKFLGGGYNSMDFINDSLVDFKGNNLTRFGREYESAVAFALLEFIPRYTLYECGSFPHPSIHDVYVAPDAIIEDPSFSFESLPGWYKGECSKRGLDKSVNWKRGVFEAKTMLFLDKKKEGPTFKPEHICQMYMEMLCTGTYWGQLLRYCHETQECRMYRLYRKPELAERLEKCITRMRKEMISGTPYNVVIDHQTNKEIIDEFRTQSNYYNAEATHYVVVPWPKQGVDKMRAYIESRDIIASHPDSEAVPTLKQIAPKKKKEAKRVSPTVLEDVTPLGVGELWSDIEATTRVMSKCFKNGDWEDVIAEHVIKEQICRLVDLEKYMALESVAKRVRLINGQEKGEEAPE